MGSEEPRWRQGSESVAGDWPHCSGARRGLGSWPGREPGGAGAGTRESWREREEATASAGAAAFREGEKGGGWRGGGRGREGRKVEVRSPEEQRHTPRGAMPRWEGKEGGHAQNTSGGTATVLRREREGGKPGARNLTPAHNVSSAQVAAENTRLGLAQMFILSRFGGWKVQDQGPGGARCLACRWPPAHGVLAGQGERGHSSSSCKEEAPP